MNKGFADPRVRPLRHVASVRRRRRGCCLELAAPRGFEPRLTDPKSAVLPLDEGAAVPEVDLGMGRRNGAEDGTRTRDPHLGKVMLYQLSHFRSMPTRCGAESQIRTGDTAIFSRVLYQLSYLGPVKTLARARRRGAEYHARRSSGKDAALLRTVDSSPAERVAAPARRHSRRASRRRAVDRAPAPGPSREAPR